MVQIYTNIVFICTNKAQKEGARFDFIGSILWAAL